MPETKTITRRVLLSATNSAYWRAILEDRWRMRLQEVTELSVAYHDAASDPDGSGGAPQEEIRRLLCRAVAARRKLADVEEALDRLVAGNFGRCEQCGSAIPDGLLAAVPDTRYCPRCTRGAALSAFRRSSTGKPCKPQPGQT